MKNTDIEQLSKKDLQMKLAGLKRELAQVQFKVFHEEHKNVREVRKLKKDIARVSMLLNTL